MQRVTWEPQEDITLSEQSRGRTGCVWEHGAPLPGSPLLSAVHSYWEMTLCGGNLTPRYPQGHPERGGGEAGGPAWLPCFCLHS